MILLCCASELGLPEDLSAIEVILYYYYYYYSDDPFVNAGTPTVSYRISPVSAETADMVRLQRGFFKVDRYTMG